MRLSTLVLLLLASSAPAAADQRVPARRVHIAAAHSPDASVEERRGLEDSATDLRDALQGRSEVALVASADEAEVRIEVVNREERDASTGGFGGQSLTPFRETIVRLRIESGGDSSALKGIGRSSWKAAAKDAAERVRKWLKTHPPAGSARNDPSNFLRITE
jgi:hypothetical protein